jgi:hypothetical protein
VLHAWVHPTVRPVIPLVHHDSVREALLWATCSVALMTTMRGE